MADPRICSVDGCGKRHKAHGLCNAHYWHLREYGDALRGSFHDGAPRRFVEQAVAWASDCCLDWPYTLGGKGYGQVAIGGNKMGLAHRIVCERAHGAPPSARHQAAHSCGNMKCVNPRHLRWATQSENEADKITHGRTNRGERQWRAKLTPDQVKQIRKEAGQMSQGALGRKYGVCRQAVGDILSGRNWAWLKPPR